MIFISCTIFGASCGFVIQLVVFTFVATFFVTNLFDLSLLTKLKKRRDVPSRGCRFQGEKDVYQLVDDGGDDTQWMHRDTELETTFAKDKTSPDPSSTTNPEFKRVATIMRSMVTGRVTDSINQLQAQSVPVDLAGQRDRRGVFAQGSFGSCHTNRRVGSYFFRAVSRHYCPEALNVF